MATKNNPGEFDCYENAGPDEPLFVLLARDETAPATIRHWVSRRLVGENNLVDDPQIVEALQCADSMEAWRLQNR